MSNAVSIAQSGANNVTMRNRIINGNMMIDQRNAGAAITPANNQFLLDRWAFCSSQASKFTSQRNQGSVTPPAGFSNYLGLTSSSAYSVTSTDYFFVIQRIEGFNSADLAWGTANAQAVTLSFRVYSSLTGTFGGVISNDGDARTYPFTFSVGSANTWTTVSVTIPGDTSGTWLTNNGVGINVFFSLGAGSSRVGTAGSWASAAVYGAAGQVNVVGTNGATFYITGVQLEKGTTATPFEQRLYGTELALCQRYFYTIVGGGNTRHAIAGNGALSQSFPVATFKVSMRTTPTFSYSSLSHFTLEGLSTGGQSTPTGISYNSGATENMGLNCTSGGSGTGQATQLLGTNSLAQTNYSAEL